MALQYLIKTASNYGRFRNPTTSSTFSTFKRQLEYQKCYKILGISEDSDQEEIRSAYLKLIKIYHPDSGTEEASAEKFSQIDEAFKLLIEKKSKERWDVNDDHLAEQDIRHTAPQHRQYLSYEGVGSGTPFQRQKQYAKYKAAQAIENVLQHRISKTTSEDKALLKTKTQTTKHKIKTKPGFDRLVEDLIQEAMSKGEFSNLKGLGKPLPDHQTSNPYVDFVTRKLNEVLIDNGFTPEWIMLQKEIHEEIQDLRKRLLIERSYFGPFPLNVEDNIDWSEIVYKLDSIVMQINRKIDKFNLVVPIMNKQMMRLCLEKEAQRVMINGSSYEDSGYTKKQNNESRNVEAKEEENGFFHFLDSLFNKNK